MASADYYLKIDTIEGESDAVGFEKTMQIADELMDEYRDTLAVLAK